jgi:hypothetical protein
MKKLVYVFVLLAVSQLFSGCDDYPCIKGSGPVESREIFLSPVSSFSFHGSGNVFLQKGQEQRIRVEGQRNILDLLETDVHAGHWDIEFDKCIKNMTELKIYITLPEVEYIALSGSGRITGFAENETFDELAVSLSGSGQIELDAFAPTVRADVTGSGRIRLNGTAEEEIVRISGSGKYRGYGMDVNTADINISGSGDAEVSVEDFLDVNIQGSGNVFYFGNPQVTSKVTGSGKVIKQ